MKKFIRKTSFVAIFAMIFNIIGAFPSLVSADTFNIPGKVEAESYISMSGVQKENCNDIGGTQDVGWISAGSSMTYSINVPVAGNYNVEFRLASQSASQFQLKDSTGTVLTTVDIPYTGGYQAWASITKNITLKAGTQEITVLAATNGWNFNFMNFTSVEAANTNTAIKILEVEPGRNFDLTDSMFVGKFNNRVAQVTTMSMVEFVAKNDFINGYYDIVYIGNNTTGGAAYSPLGEKVDPNQIIVVPLNGTVAAYDKNNQYRGEVDITDKKAGDSFTSEDPAVQEQLRAAAYTDAPYRADQQNYSVEAGLKAFIASGQLMIFNDSIFTTTSLNGTKLFKNFINYKTTNIRSNVKFITSVNVDAIVSGFNAANNRSIVSLSSLPTPYIGGNEATFATNRLLSFNFNVTNGSDFNNALTVKLYLDIDGDSLFKDNEAVATETILGGSSGTNSISYLFSSNFYGLMPWKLEITDNVTKVKSLLTGNVAYKGADYVSTPLVRVLQLNPGSQGTSTGTYDFGRQSNSVAPLYVQGKYNIQVTNMYIEDFKNNYRTDGNGKTNAILYDTTSDGVARVTNVSDASTNINGLNGQNTNYDMIIFGFADNYNSKDISSISDATVANAIKAFIKTGQSVMFTHDTIEPQQPWGVANAKYFQDIVGQSRFFDLNNPTQQNSDGSLIPHVATNATNSQMGFSKQVLNGQGITSNKTFKFNNGVINQYPYGLGDITVQTTHQQWLQLNLEDENVIPWYTLLVSGIDQYDGGNSYYTYSKGNITFSGTGHSYEPGNSQEEQKLFINTVLKASRTANHAPVVQINNLTDQENISKYQDVKFNFTTNDLDGDNVNATISIKNSAGTIIASSSTDSRIKTTTTGLSFSNIPSGSKVGVTIPKEVLVSSNLLLGGSFTVYVNVEDPKHAPGSDSRTLNYVDIPSMDITSDKDSYGILKGDSLSSIITAATSGSGYYPNYQINNITTTTSSDDNANIGMIGNRTNWINSISFDASGVVPINLLGQSETITFNPTVAKLYTVDSSYAYDIITGITNSVIISDVSNDVTTNSNIANQVVGTPTSSTANSGPTGTFTSTSQFVSNGSIVDSPPSVTSSTETTSTSTIVTSVSVTIHRVTTGGVTTYSKRVVTRTGNRNNYSYPTVTTNYSKTDDTIVTTTRTVTTKTTTKLPIHEVKDNTFNVDVKQGVVDVTVYNQLNNPITLKPLAIHLLNATTNATVATVTSDSTGHVRFVDIPSGNYKISGASNGKYIYSAANVKNVAVPNVGLGYTTPTVTTSIFYDVTAPTTPVISYIIAPTKGPVTITIDYDDVHNPSITKYKSIDGGLTYTPYTEPFNVTQNCTITAKSVDNEDIVSQIARANVDNIDNIAPNAIIKATFYDKTGNIIGSPIDLSNMFSNSNNGTVNFNDLIGSERVPWAYKITLTITAEDNASGGGISNIISTGRTTYTYNPLDPANNPTYTGDGTKHKIVTANYDITTNNGTIAYTLSDLAGNTLTRNITFKNIDLTAPTITATATVTLYDTLGNSTVVPYTLTSDNNATISPSNSNFAGYTGWTQKDIQISITSNDLNQSGVSESGVKEISLPGSNNPNSGSTGSFTIGSNATYSFTVKDNVGNSVTKTINVTNIDKADIPQLVTTAKDNVDGTGTVKLLGANNGLDKYPLYITNISVFGYTDNKPDPNKNSSYTNSKNTSEILTSNDYPIITLTNNAEVIFSYVDHDGHTGTATQEVIIGTNPDDNGKDAIWER